MTLTWAEFEDMMAYVERRISPDKDPVDISGSMPNGTEELLKVRTDQWLTEKRVSEKWHAEAEKLAARVEELQDQVDYLQEQRPSKGYMPKEL